jgi:hypothetical protein
MGTNRDCVKNAQKCQSFYLFDKLSLEDFNIEFIFYHLPKLGEVVESEYISGVN